MTEAKYTIIFKTLAINVGVMRKNPEIDTEVWVVETANKSNKLAIFIISNMSAERLLDMILIPGLRISESYAIYGKKLANYIY